MQTLESVHSRGFAYRRGVRGGGMYGRVSLRTLRKSAPLATALPASATLLHAQASMVQADACRYLISTVGIDPNAVDWVRGSRAAAFALRQLTPVPVHRWVARRSSTFCTR